MIEDEDEDDNIDDYLEAALLRIGFVCEVCKSYIDASKDKDFLKAALQAQKEGWGLKPTYDDDMWAVFCPDHK